MDILRVGIYSDGWVLFYNFITYYPGSMPNKTRIGNILI